MPIEDTGETRVRTDCLNFDISLCTRAYAWGLGLTPPPLNLIFYKKIITRRVY